MHRRQITLQAFITLVSSATDWEELGQAAPLGPGGPAGSHRAPARLWLLGSLVASSCLKQRGSIARLLHCNTEQLAQLCRKQMTI